AEVLAATPGTVTRGGAGRRDTRSWRRGRELRAWHPGPPEVGDDVVSPDMEDAVVAAAFHHRGDAGRSLTISAPPSEPREGVLVRTSSLTRRFGSTVALDDVSVEVRSGEIVGVIGANGAGKTTLIRLLLGLLTPSAGDIVLFGEPPSRTSRHLVGYVPQGLGLYRDLTVSENLSFVATAYGRPAPPQADLAQVADDLVGEIGLGRQRRLAFACALSHAPALLVLDEPTSGVDPISRARLWDTIHEQAEAGVGVLVSTHHMQEAEQCDRLVLMDLGRVVADGRPRDVIGASLRR
ncbi:MAG TPA: ABC transporter ATP-binding protein, partial [Acidimicrobiales bacterium]